MTIGQIAANRTARTRAIRRMRIRQINSAIPF